MNHQQLQHMWPRRMVSKACDACDAMPEQDMSWCA